MVVPNCYLFWFTPIVGALVVDSINKHRFCNVWMLELDVTCTLKQRMHACMSLVIINLRMQASSISLSSANRPPLDPHAVDCANTSGLKKVAIRFRINLVGLLPQLSAASSCLLVKTIPYPSTNSTVACSICIKISHACIPSYRALHIIYMYLHHSSCFWALYRKSCVNCMICYHAK